MDLKDEDLQPLLGLSDQVMKMSEIVDSRIALLESQVLALQDQITELQASKADAFDPMEFLAKIMPELRREMMRQQALFRRDEKQLGR
ncbi:hypothetical protein C7441_1105 [Pseudaminobacter salicylatoxidans]|uniref:Uncharacterized protein n=1 Tax=Pseudaminobacter salicylatoxidans TaxID=93369 RepID=A0A316C1S2_PSESE|nr:hypothetical protein [Pseudaminobacter salicylatoxidans]PWJ81474.1 hypothetical protein C7441_1105 [Pseudaminobacter salicylatoxidans]